MSAIIKQHQLIGLHERLRSRSYYERSRQKIILSVTETVFDFFSESWNFAVFSAFQAGSSTEFSSDTVTENSVVS